MVVVLAMMVAGMVQCGKGCSVGDGGGYGAVWEMVQCWWWWEWDIIQFGRQFSMGDISNEETYYVKQKEQRK